MFSASEIADLEKKYSKYLMKKFFKYLFVIALTLVISSSVAYYAFLYKPSKIKEGKVIIKQEKNTKKTKPLIKESNISIIITEKNTSIPTIPKSTEKNSSKEKIVKNKIRNSKVVEKPNSSKSQQKEQKEDKLYFHIKPSDDLSFESSQRASLKLNIPTVKTDTNTTKIAKIEVKDDTIKEEKTVLPKVPKIKIEMQDIDSIRYLKDKYENTHNIIFALMLCEEYYSQKDYENSLKWSIIANDIDNNSERSWVWFAKSKYRLGKKDDAVRALKAYLKANESNTVKSLLKNIENGRLDD